VQGRVSFDPGDRALYATDASNYRLVPTAVVLPKTLDDVVATVAACRAAGASLVPRGAGTSLAGQATGTGVVLDTSRYLNRIIEIDPDRRLARVEPGVVLDDLRAAAAPYGLTFGPDPSSASRCTIGGMVGNNSCGSHSVAWGTTADNVERLDVLLYDGTRLDVGHIKETAAGRIAEVDAFTRRHLALIRQRFPQFSRRVSGYALDRLLPEHGGNVAQALVGTEGTCATVLETTVRLVPLPAARVLLVLGFPDVFTAADAVPAILPHRPLTVEGINDQLIASLPLGRDRWARRALPDGKAWLLVEIGDDSIAAATERAQALGSGVSARLVSDPAEQKALWQIRKDGAGLATRMPDGSEAWPGWEDAAVPPERLGSYLRGFQDLLDRHDRRGLVYGHFGEGCLHARIDFDLFTERGVAAFRRFVEEAADLVVAHGGSLSGEHGDGAARSELLQRQYGADAVRAFEEFKAIWDPDDRMNPGTIVRPRLLDESLRYGPGYPRQRELLTVFAYPQDAGRFDQAIRRCVGIGKCRQSTGGVMCPSYRVTREERHSTRGRAHLLEEMLRGDVVTGGWRSNDVRDALDLCLSCKGCKSDCPVNVDMATYKAEFLHHHYARRIRPPSHYSMGWLPLWARAAALAPGLGNAATRSPWLAPAIKRLGGIAAQRQLPEFAAEPFTRWFLRRPRRAAAGRTVLLWPDTFDNYLTPDVAVAATEVLENAGFRVALPPRGVCCGLTWISTGQLGVARRVLRRALDVVAPALDAGVPVVGLEPSCTAVLRSDLPELLPDDPRASRLAAQTATFAEFLTQQATDWVPPQLRRRAITQTHCHQHAVLGFGPDEALLARLGVDNRTLDSGCCGLAGNFGFERGHYEVSKACGELALLPAVRAASHDTLVLADGFSCRTQIAQETGRQALHLAQVVQMALTS